MTATLQANINVDIVPYLSYFSKKVKVTCNNDDMMTTLEANINDDILPCLSCFYYFYMLPTLPCQISPMKRKKKKNTPSVSKFQIIYKFLDAFHYSLDHINLCPS